MKKIRLLAVVILLAMSISVSVYPKFAFAIGIISSPIEARDVLRGQEIKEKLKILNSEEKEVEFALDAVGDIADWVVFYENDANSQITTTKIPAKSRKEIQVLIKIPNDIPNGEYRGSLNVKYDPNQGKQKDKSFASVLQQVSREVLITVTDQEIINFSSSVTPQIYTLKKNEPLQINAVYYNSGNTSIKPDLQIKVTKNGRNIFNAIFPYPENEGAVNPLETKKITVLYQTTGLEKGKYKADVAVFLGEKEYHKDDFAFTVGIADSDSRKNLAFISKIGGGALIFGLLLAAAIFLISARKKKRLLKKKKKK